MADEFNLSPTNNTEKFLDDILRTAQGEQAQFNLVPNWRIEQYLEAIKNALVAGGGGSGGDKIVIFEPWSEDFTYTNVADAFDAGKAVLVFENSSGIRTVRLVAYMEVKNNAYFVTAVGAYADHDQSMDGVALGTTYSSSDPDEQLSEI